MSYSVSELAARLGLAFQGDADRPLVRASGWAAADSSCLVFLDGRKQGSLQDLPATACVIASPGSVPAGRSAILSNNPKLDFSRAALLLAPPAQGQGRWHPSADVSPGADVDCDVDIGPYVSIAPGARVKRGCVLHPGVTIGSGCELGTGCVLYPRVVLYPGAKLGDRVVLHAGTVVGSDGFGYVFDGANQVKFPQIGSVIIEDDVEIGANSTIDRGSLGTTRIGAGTKIDNLVQIAHNVYIGRSVVIAAQTGISGSTVIEDNAIIGGQVGFGDHARVEKGAIIGSKAGVLPGKIVRGGQVYWGVPVRPLAEYKRLNALFGRLPEMKAEIQSLKESVAKLWALLQEEKKD
jgi:UDP-3-O-[3-hydroxymyristoyl] glucosamine N-acyltransferase